MNKTLIVGATSDIAFNYIQKKKPDNIVIISRDKLKTKSLYPNNRFNESIYLNLNDINEIYNKFNNYVNNFDKIIFFNGIDIIKPIQFYKKDEIINSFNVNIISIFCLLSLLSKNKSIKNKSSIVIISSISGNTKGSRGHSLYSTTKASISGMVKSLSLEFSKLNIRINSILAGLIKTNNLYNKNLSLESKKSFNNYLKKYPLGIGNYTDINNLIDFLIGNESDWMTGQNIVLDGGYSVE
tara:strand:+ start:5158 stop:5877 length:720 start_codon:yes stop_codon:yes gene_type:complete